MAELVEEASKKASEERDELRNQMEWWKSSMTGDFEVFKRRRQDFLKQKTPPVIRGHCTKSKVRSMRLGTCNRDSGDCTITTESHTLQYDNKHMPKSSDITSQKNNSNESLYLNKKTQQMPKQGKYVPTVLEDCKPRNPKLMTPKPVTPKHVKREKNYAGRKNLSVIEDDSLICANDQRHNGNNVNRHFYNTRRRSRLENTEMPMKVRHGSHQENEEKYNDIGKESNQEQNQDENSAFVPHKGQFDLAKERKQSHVDLDIETSKFWNLLKDGYAGDERMGEEKNEFWEKERKVFGEGVEGFITIMRTMQGNRQFSPWKGSVLDSVVGVFLTQNVSDHLSSSTYMRLAAKFPFHSTRDHNSCHENCIMGIQNMESVEHRKGKKKKSNRSHVKKIQISGATRRHKSKKKNGKGDTFDWDSLRRTYWSEKPRSSDHKDSANWEAVRHAKVSKVASTIQARGQHNVIAGRIQEFLNQVVRLHGSLDLEWLRDVPPQETKKYLLGINGLGLKSVECLRLLTLQHVAFPVDINVARIVVRLGWVPLKPLPEGVQIHLLKKYPMLNPIQKYLWPRLCHLDQETLYELHYHMITFGKVFCTKKNPNCNACPMRGGCKHFASAFASAKLALPGPSNETTTTASPVSPERDIEDMISESERNVDAITCDDSDNYKQKNLMANLEDGDFSKDLVAISCEAAAIPMPKFSRLRTEHQVYELPDSHPLLEGLDAREQDDPSSYLLAVQTSGKNMDEERCNSHEFQEQNLSTVRGTILIPCRTAMRGQFALNGTYFQTNEVFADNESSHHPIDVPREWLSNLPSRIVYFGTSALSIFRGLSAELIECCFRQGYICVRGFDRKSRAPRPLLKSLHRSTTSAKQKETSED